MKKANPILLLTLGTLAFLAGREGARRKLAVGDAVPRDLPLPPPPLPGLEAVAQPLEDWGLDFDVRMFPANASTAGMQPPESPASASASQNCDAIAIGDLWMGTAVSVSLELIEDGLPIDFAILQAMRSMLPDACQPGISAAFTLLRDEVSDIVNPPVFEATMATRNGDTEAVSYVTGV